MVVAETNDTIPWLKEVPDKVWVKGKTDIGKMKGATTMVSKEAEKRHNSSTYSISGGGCCYTMPKFTW